MNSGIYEYIHGELHFYNTPFNIRDFIYNTIQQQQRIINYFMQQALNPRALPWTPKNNYHTNESNETNNNNKYKTILKETSSILQDMENETEWITPRRRATTPLRTTSLN